MKPSLNIPWSITVTFKYTKLHKSTKCGLNSNVCWKVYFLGEISTGSMVHLFFTISHSYQKKILRIPLWISLNMTLIMHTQCCFFLLFLSPILAFFYGILNIMVIKYNFYLYKKVTFIWNAIHSKLVHSKLVCLTDVGFCNILN